MNISEADIRQIYFHCKNDNPNGLYHNKDDELDIVEFGTKVAEYVALRAAQEAKREEHMRCVQLVKDINVAAATYLLDNKQYAD